MSEQLSAAADCPSIGGAPALGVGTWQNEDPEQCAASVKTALEAGYRHVDTAQIYGNESAVGDGIAAADVDRDDIFLATKVWIDNLDFDDVIATTEESLDKLGVDAVDLLYVHWPARAYEPEETFSAFAELRERGLIDHVGISNFLPEQVDEAIDVSDVPIEFHQFEIHPFLPQRELVDHCQDRDVTVVGYSPLARGGVLDDPTIGEIAEKHGVSEAQVSLAWLRQRDVVTIPKATSTDHVHDNWRSLDLELDPDDVDRIDAIDREERCVDPSFGPWN
ncbi:aldo/keto reductase [Salinarchaeum laminariae]|uniref:aldo/keto reductase n=1 Tax=Salinarchaeum laminariae TaxID=869888 RepID=UPI0020BEB7C0|nr:aldo/keto reductase [Salinarchaeum laminariae]